jgi:hypothetical protein
MAVSDSHRVVEGMNTSDRSVVDGTAASSDFVVDEIDLRRAR